MIDSLDNFKLIINNELQFVHHRLTSRARRLQDAARLLGMNGVNVPRDEVDDVSRNCHDAADHFGQQLRDQGLVYDGRQWLQKPKK